MKRRVLSFVLTVLLTLCLIPQPAHAAFIDNPNWIETTTADITNRKECGERFVVMYYRETCFNSKLRKTMLDRWMTDYDITVYGVNIDRSRPPYWIITQTGSPYTLPVIAIVSSPDSYSVFTAADNMRSIQDALHRHLGIVDQADTDFSRLNGLLLDSYLTNKKFAEQYLPDMSSFITAACKAFQAELETIRQTYAPLTDYELAQAIYTHVASTIYYHYGMLDGSVIRHTSAYDTLWYGASVCEGYANLTAALCWTAGLPCRVVSGFATGQGTEVITDTVWGRYQQYLADGDLAAFCRDASSFANHAWNEVYVDGRWIVLDSTWGSNNEKYPPDENNVTGVIRGAPSMDYFDISPEKLAETHLFWTPMSGTLLPSRSNGADTVLLTPSHLPDNQTLLARYNAQKQMISCQQVDFQPDIFTEVSLSSEISQVAMFLTDSDWVPRVPVSRLNVQ